MKVSQIYLPRNIFVRHTIGGGVDETIICRVLINVDALVRITVFWSYVVAFLRSSGVML